MSGQAAGSSLSRIYDSTQGTWRALELPVGQLTLRGQPYGTLAFPTARLTAFLLEPLRGNLGELPAGNIRLEVLGGAVVNIPLTQVQLYQRDVARGTLRVTLMDEQMFSGKVLELPKVSLSVDTGREKQSIPLDRVAQMERTPPGGRRF